MNLWRNNRYYIQSQVKKIIHTSTLTLPISITISDLPNNFSSQFEKFSSSEDSKIAKSLDNEVLEIEKDTYSKSTRELESLSLDLQTSVNSDHIDLDLPDDGEEIKHREFELSRQEWDLISPKSFENTLEPGCIIITKMSYASTIVGNHLNGYVQMLCHTPLLIHLYSEEQICC